MKKIIKLIAPKKNIKYLVYILALIAIGAVIGLGTNFIYGNFLNKKDLTAVDTDAVKAGKNIGGISYISNLPEPALISISAFIKSAYQVDYLPKELEIKLATKAEQTGDQYAGSWTAQEKVFLVLYVVANNDNSTPRYLRTWSLDTGVDVNQKLAETSLTAYFNKQYIQTVGSLTCSSIKNFDSTENEFINDCSSIKTNELGDKVGISVRAPVLTPSGEKGTLTAACFIPKPLTVGYYFKICI